MPLLSRLLDHFSSTPRMIPGPYSLGTWSIPLNIIGLIFLLFASITFNFPIFSPVNKDNMNYTSAAIGVIALISIVTWLTTGRKHFTGPRINVRALHAKGELEGAEQEGDGTVSGTGSGVEVVEKPKDRF